MKFIKILFNCLKYAGMVLLVCFIFPAHWGQSETETGTSNIVQALSSDRDTGCYDRADGPVPVQFPLDRGPHEKFKTEWWYYTGNLRTAAGRHFGYQLTFFRQSLGCGPQAGDSAWRTRQIYFAHFAVTDTQNGKFHSFQRMNRDSIGIAGARSVPFSLWVDNWSSREAPGEKIRLKARDKVETISGDQDNRIIIDLLLDPVKPVILQGNRGWSKKGPGPSDASYYYSFPGMITQGSLTLNGETHQLSGHSWFDHEWSTSALNRDVAGWDWFAIHLDTGPHRGTDIMVCQIRKSDHSPNGYGFGSISFPDGRSAILDSTGFSIRPTRYWTSPGSGRKYPAGWVIQILGQNLTLAVSPVMDGQEHAHTFSYYEGAVKIDNKDASGFGHVEMTGY
jgi:predicted secreted hydrolase